MRRRLVTVGLCCAALAATAPVPAALAQNAGSSAPKSATSSAAASTATPASSAVPAGTLPPATSAAPASTPAPASTAAPASTTVPGAVSAQTPGSSSDDSRTPIVLLAIVGLLLLLAALTWAFARWWAWEPMWWIRWRHATAEAGWRTSAAWAEFRDWLRLGR